jgi:hypothetical protein
MVEDDLVKVVKHETPRCHQPEAVSLACHLRQASPCCPRRSGFASQHRAASQRIGRVTGVIRRRDLLRRWRTHCYAQAKRWVKKVRRDADFGFLPWTRLTHYPAWRVAELQACRDRFPAVITRRWLREYVKCKCFIKAKPFPCFKNGRGIASRTDMIKAWIGPVIKQVELNVYKCPFFVKHVPVPDRPKYIYKHVYSPGAKYMSTDYSCFEASFKAEIMHTCEFVLLKYALSDCPLQLKYIKWFEQICTGKNKMVYRDGTFTVMGKRMSGEMTTSLANGWTNFCLATFVIRRRNIRMVIEGDDGLIAIYDSDEITAQKFLDLGFIIKIEVHKRIEEASFCGLVFDVDDMMNVVDPIQKLVEFGWYQTTSLFQKPKRLNEVLVAKAYSLLYEYPGCPVVREIAAYVFRVRRPGEFDFDHYLNRRDLSIWDRDRFLKVRDALGSEDRVKLMLARPISMKSRMLMERVFKIPVSVQFEIEKYLKSLKRLQVLDMPFIVPYLSVDSQRMNALRFEFPVGTPVSHVRYFMSWS